MEPKFTGDADPTPMRLFPTSGTPAPHQKIAADASIIHHTGSHQSTKEALHLRQEVQKLEGLYAREKLERAKSDNKVQELSRKASELEQKIAAQNKTLLGQSTDVAKKSKLEDRIRDLTLSRDNFESQLNEKIHDLQQVEANAHHQVEAANRLIADLQFQHATMAANISTRNAEIDAKSQQIDELKCEIAALTTESARLCESNKWHKEQLDQLNALVSQKADDVFQRDEVLTNIQGDIESKNVELRDALAKIHTLNSDIETLNGTVAKYKLDLEATKVEMAAAKATAQEKTKELSLQTNALRDAEHSVQFLTQRCNTMSNEMRVVETTASDLRVQLQKSEAAGFSNTMNYATLHDKFVEQRRLCEEALEARDRNAKLIEAERKEFAAKEASLMQQLQSQEETIASRTHEIQERSFAQEELERSLARMNADNGNLREEVARLEVQTAVLAEQCDAKRHEMDGHLSFAETNAAKARAMEAKASEYKAIIIERDGTVATLLSSLEAEKAKHQQLQVKSTQSISERDAAIATNELTIAELGIKISELSIEAAKVPILEAELAQAKHMCETTAQELSDVSAALAKETDARQTAESQLQDAVASSNSCEATLSASISTLRTELQSQVARCESLQLVAARVPPLESTVATQAESLKQTQQRAEEAEESAKQLSANLASLKEEYDRELTAAQRSANELRRKFETQSSAASAEHEATMAAINAEKNTLTQKVVVLESNLCDVRNSFATVQEDLTRKITEFEILQGRHETSLEELAAVKLSLQEQMDVFNAQSSETHVKVQALATELRSVRSQLLAAQKAEQSTTTDCSRLRSRLEEKENDFDRVNAELVKSIESQRKIEGRYRDVNKRCDEYKNALRNVEDKLTKSIEYRKLEMAHAQQVAERQEQRITQADEAHNKLYDLYCDLLDVYEGRKAPSAAKFFALKEDYSIARSTMLAAPPSSSSTIVDKENIMAGDASTGKREEGRSSSRPPKRQRSERVVEIHQNVEE